MRELLYMRRLLEHTLVSLPNFARRKQMSAQIPAKTPRDAMQKERGRHP